MNLTKISNNKPATTSKKARTCSRKQPSQHQATTIKPREITAIVMKQAQSASFTQIFGANAGPRIAQLVAARFHDPDDPPLTFSFHDAALTSLGARLTALPAATRALLPFALTMPCTPLTLRSDILLYLQGAPVAGGVAMPLDNCILPCSQTAYGQVVGFAVALSTNPAIAAANAAYINIGAGIPAGNPPTATILGSS